MHFTSVTAALLLAWVAVPAHAASFDCTKARSQVEHLVCDTPTLSQQDETLASTYRVALANDPVARQRQVTWLRETRDRCGDVSCLAAAYQTQIQVMRASVPIATPTQVAQPNPVPAAMAQSSIRVNCDDRFSDDLKWKLADLDKPVFGVRARDWSTETVRDWQRQALACINGKINWSEEAMRAPMRKLINATASNPSELFAVRDDNLRKEGRQSTVANQNLSQVTMNNGMPQEIGIDDESRTCTSISKGIGLSSEENYRQAIAFARLCQQVGYTKADTVSTLEAMAARVAPIRKMLEDFASRVDAQARQPQVSPDAIQALRKQRDALYEQFKATGLMTHPAYPPNSKRLGEAESKLDGMWQKVQESTCEGQFLKAGMPGKWKANLIIMELNSPEPFQPLVCSALRNGAQVRYLSGGLLSKEGFEVKSPKRTVQVFVGAERVPGGDPDVQVMVPVAVKIDGKSTDVTRNNLRAVVAELIAAMRNQ